jgi:hypothetical protein
VDAEPSGPNAAQIFRNGYLTRTIGVFRKKNGGFQLANG